MDRLRQSQAEAVQNKEETELKCQHKIADMVALMEKHKVGSTVIYWGSPSTQCSSNLYWWLLLFQSQYDRIVEEKDTQLSEHRKRETEAAAHLQSVVRFWETMNWPNFSLLIQWLVAALEYNHSTFSYQVKDLNKHKSDSDKLKQQLKKEVAEQVHLLIQSAQHCLGSEVVTYQNHFLIKRSQENLQKELTHLKKDMSSMKASLVSDMNSKQVHNNNPSCQEDYTHCKFCHLSQPALATRLQLATPSYVQRGPVESPGSSKMNVYELSKVKKTPLLSKTGKTPVSLIREIQCWSAGQLLNYDQCMLYEIVVLLSVYFRVLLVVLGENQTTYL